MPDRLVRDFPLFPLEVVALPHEYVPLHIFEERYKTMIGECLEQEKEFGIVWLSDEGLRPIGCACEITEVLEQLEDGRPSTSTATCTRSAWRFPSAGTGTASPTSSDAAPQLSATSSTGSAREST